MAKRPGAKGDFSSPIIGGRLLMETGADEPEDFTDEIEEIIAKLKIDPNGLTDEASNHSSIFARIAILSEEASHNARWAKRGVDLAKADLNGKLRQEYSKEGTKKPSEDAFKAMIEADSSISDQIDEQLNAERTAGILKALVSSVRDRREMIAEMMRDKRHEWKVSGGDD